MASPHLFPPVQKIDKAEYEKRIRRISGLYAGMIEHAGTQTLTRCPYKNRHDQCTAKFGCRNQRRPPVKGDLLMCGGDDKIDYRPAWESDPLLEENVRRTLKKNSAPIPENGDGPVASVVHEDRRCPAIPGKTIFDHADVLEVKIPTSCGRSGICHECVVEIHDGMDALSEPSVAEAFLKSPYRLACQAEVKDTTRDVAFGQLKRMPKILTSQSHREVELNPMVTRRGDAVFYGDEEIDRFREHLFGLALDVGTTTVAAELVNLETGKPVYLASFENPQRFGGSDIMHRISYDGGVYQGELHQSIINAVNHEILEMCRKVGFSRHEIYEIVVVGNSTMRDIFFDIDVQTVGEKPYMSRTELDMLDGKTGSTSITRIARKLRLRTNRNARVFGAPLIGCHVGADVVADLMAMDMETQDGLVMMVDVGTNTEIVIGTPDRLLAASCPAGPAFEGGLVKYGMSGSDGAIESIRIRDGQFVCDTIGGGEPRGICGSGLIDLLAELRRHEWCTPKGVFIDKKTEFEVVPERGITLSRLDASHLAQAKAASYCGQWILMRTIGARPEDIQRVYLAGGFANYVDPQAAIDIGFLAPVSPDRIVKIGNAALQGAREMLLSRTKRESIERLARSIEHVELETTPDFFEIFTDGCQLQPMKF
jgi:uncharacterized 2Fe-2S/4Fe-4S cluster protein (DUF4445 family)